MDIAMKFINSITILEQLLYISLLIGKLNFLYLWGVEIIFELQGYFETWEKYSLDCLFEVKTKGSS